MALIARAYMLFKRNAQGVLSSLAPLLFLAIFTAIGAALFQWIEYDAEQDRIQQSRELRIKDVEEAAFRLNTIKNMSPIQAFNHTVKTLHMFAEDIGSPMQNQTNVQWTYWGAVYFTITIYTTIGYGNIACSSTYGQIFTILYAFIGIPIALMCLIGLGSQLATLSTHLWTIFRKATKMVNKDLDKKMENLEIEKSKATDEDDKKDLLDFPISFLIIIAIMYVLGVAGIFMLIEKDWTYFTSLYFVLISFLTIGLGDVLVQSDHIIVVGILLLVGLSIISTVLNIIQAQIEELTIGMQKSIDDEYLNALQKASKSGELTEEQKYKLRKGSLPSGERISKERSLPGETSVLIDDTATESGIPPILPSEEESNVDPKALEVIISKMPLRSRLMYYAMPSSNKKRLQEHVNAKNRLATIATQTEDFMFVNKLHRRVSTHK